MALEPEPSGGPSDGPPPQAFTVSITELVTRTFTLWTRKLVPYVAIVGALSVFLIALGVAIGVFLPSIVYASDLTSLFSLLLGTTVSDYSTFVVVSLLVILIGLVITAIISGAATHYALEDYGYKRADVGTSVSHALSKFVSIFLVLLIVQLLNAAVVGPLGYFTLESIDITDPLNPVINMDAMNGMLMMFVFAIVLMYVNIRITPTSAIILAEDRSAIDSFKRAFELTGGNFFHIFAGLFLMLITVAVIDIVITLVVGSFIAILISAMVLASLNYVFQAVLYRDLLSRTATSSQGQTDWW
ncbi:MAG: hypothetical protein ACTSQZ_09560 [Candidatus Thorarchaeota archaeon]